jgi:hypothetical protein
MRSRAHQHPKIHRGKKEGALSASDLLMCALTCASLSALNLGCDDEDAKGPSTAGTTAGTDAGTTAGTTAGADAGVTPPPQSFCERYTATCGAWTGPSSCEEWFNAAPAGVEGDTEGATRACYEYHLSVAASMTSTPEAPSEHCAHARGEAVCVDAPPAPTVGIATGKFAQLSEAGANIKGRAQLTWRLTEGVTDIEVYAYGLSASTAYGGAPTRAALRDQRRRASLQDRPNDR